MDFFLSAYIPVTAAAADTSFILLIGFYSTNIILCILLCLLARASIKHDRYMCVTPKQMIIYPKKIF